MPLKPRIILSVTFAFALLGSSCPPAARAQWPSDPSVNLPIVTAPSHQSFPVAARDSDGGTFVVWLDRRDGATQWFDVYATRILPSGQVDPAWPHDGLSVAATSLDERALNVMADPAGGVFVAWTAWDPFTVPDDDDDVLLQHLMPNGTVDPLWPQGGRLVISEAGSQHDPQLVPDGLGGVIVVWGDDRNWVEEVYAQHVRGDGSLDPSWPSQGLRVSPEAGAQSDPRALADGNGGALVVWSDNRNDPSGDLVAQHLLPGGVLDPSWPDHGTVVSAAVHSQTGHRLATDGAAGLIVVWQDSRGADVDIYAQHVTASGVVDPAWPSTGLAVCTAPISQTHPAVVPDGNGGAIVCWEDQRSSDVFPDIFALRILAEGVLAPSWPQDGIAVCDTFNSQHDASLVPDGEGGAIVCWTDARPDHLFPDIYASRIRVDGSRAPSWPSQGRALCTAADAQGGASIVPDGRGGAVVVWGDRRNGVDLDVYAQRVKSDGTLGGEVVDAPHEDALALALEPPRPNPARGGTLALRFTLARTAPAVLEVFDVAGRRLAARAVGTLGPGRHAVTLELPAGSGLRLVRLRQGGAARLTRVMVLE